MAKAAGALQSLTTPAPSQARTRQQQRWWAASGLPA